MREDERKRVKKTRERKGKRSRRKVYRGIEKTENRE